MFALGGGGEERENDFLILHFTSIVCNKSIWARGEGGSFYGIFLMSMVRPVILT